jgi:hypothetical protein
MTSAFACWNSSSLSPPSSCEPLPESSLLPEPTPFQPIEMTELAEAPFRTMSSSISICCKRLNAILISYSA